MISSRFWLFSFKLHKKNPSNKTKLNHFQRLLNFLHPPHKSSTILSGFSPERFLFPFPFFPFSLFTSPLSNHGPIVLILFICVRETDSAQFFFLRPFEPLITSVTSQLLPSPNYYLQQPLANRLTASRIVC